MEEWKTVEIDGVTYKDYEVSTKGRVRNVKTGRILKGYSNQHGYLLVGLYKNEKKKDYLIHRIVAFTFIPNPNNYDTVDHINHNRKDNRVENLRWLPLKNNAKDGGSIIGERLAKKVKCTNITTKEVQIFDSLAQASEILKLSRGNICECCKGKRKSCGGFTFEYIE